ncbi:MAG: AAA family ATPase [Acutalibacter sp.]|jgi:predicted kinase|uniref:AAA family ATPase n=1 Tax=Acutalibacter sp. TaxID=1918636 RepID=UPI002171BA36|nr:AAA family ATPase [Acutalibacter sp.]MCI9224881.1 AAA family ATPase [Acutalibacter sp.]
MGNGMLILISGPCGSGKTTVSRLLADSGKPPSVHMHTDDFYEYIRKGYIPPWREDSGDQNETVINAICACAREYVRGGYMVYVDGVIGPWFLAPWRALAKRGLDLRYIVLRPDKGETMARAAEREQRAEFPLQPENVAFMWDMFADLGEYERHAVNTAGQSPNETAALVSKALDAGLYRIL